MNIFWGFEANNTGYHPEAMVVRKRLAIFEETSNYQKYDSFTQEFSWKLRKVTFTFNNSLTKD